MGSGGIGGFGGGDSFGEAADERNMMQPSISSNSNKSSGAGSKSGFGGGGSAPQNQQKSQPPIEPREVADISEEAKRGVVDVWIEVKKFFSLNAWLGIDPENMDPEEQARAKQFHAKYQQLDQEQQAVARQMYQEKIQKKKVLDEEENRKKEIEAQEKAQSVVMPSSPQKGAQGSGGKSKKSQVMQKMKQDRTTIGTTQGE